MELIQHLIEIVLHLDEHLIELVRRDGAWTYAILCLIVFCETGLVVTPFLPGDSLLFAVGAVAATGGLDPSINARGPDLLCLPVDKNGGDPSAPANPNSLLCLRTGNDRLPFPEKTLFITNQFGSFKKVITQYDDFCVPATVTVP